jgi:hypothetical protein
MCRYTLRRPSNAPVVLIDQAMLSPLPLRKYWPEIRFRPDPSQTNAGLPDHSKHRVVINSIQHCDVVTNSPAVQQFEVSVPIWFHDREDKHE